MYLFNKAAMIIIAVLLFTTAITADAQSENGEVVTRLDAHSNDGIFNDNASYTFDVKNTSNTDQQGKISYLVTTPYGVPVLKDSVKVKIAKNGSEFYNFDIPKVKAGFYKISFMINVTDYDDTTRRVFGIRPQEITTVHPRPADFDNFWKNTKAELAAIKPEFKVSEKPEMEKENRKVYLVEMKSLDNLTVKAWLTMPLTKVKDRKAPVLVELPGYQVGLSPLYGDDEDIAIITLNVRGQGNSRDVLHTKREDFLTLNIEDKNKYVMRGVIMDCMRIIDFIYTRDDLDHDRIEVSGGSMGGYLAVALAGLDNRMALVSAQNPILSDIRSQVGEVEWPLNDIIKYTKEKPGITFSQVMDNMDYYDIKNFAPNIRKPILIGMGLLDHLAPPNSVYVLYNTIPKKHRELMIFKDLGHEVSKDYVEKDGHRMRDVFAMF